MLWMRSTKRATRDRASHAGSVVHAVRLAELSKAYSSGEGTVLALDKVSVDLARGSFTAVMGPSGSGKSTLLHCAAGLDQPTSGEVWLGDEELSAAKEARLTVIRRERVGFAFQAYNLLGSLTAEQNITLPLLLADRAVDAGHVREVASAVGIAEHPDRRPGQLSGDHRQRAEGRVQDRRAGEEDRRVVGIRPFAIASPQTQPTKKAASPLDDFT